MGYLIKWGKGIKMTKRKLTKPSIATMSIWKAILVGGFVCIGVYFSIWGSSVVLLKETNSLMAVCLGGGMFLIGILNWWVWRPGHKYMTRWYIAAVGNFYFSLVFLLPSIFGLAKSLKNPWGWYVNGALVMFYFLAWLLPFLSYGVANKISRKQDLFGLHILKYGSVGGLLFVAGVIGKNWSSSVIQNQSATGALVGISFLCSLLAVFVAQYSSVYLWNCRPRNKENVK